MMYRWLTLLGALGAGVLVGSALMWAAKFFPLGHP